MLAPLLISMEKTLPILSIILITPTGITLCLILLEGVFITTADLLPIKARAMGIIFFVSSGVKLKIEAIP